ncbi:reverse transcriptase domain-containing protein [Tanacetum coccineum]|uniref:Reverse transcriptase domain-containing protein n=1 Tax=Tanacetum coccineum TaxID=301880 RepID=A0ABQ5G7V4_9ASTR
MTPGMSPGIYLVSKQIEFTASYFDLASSFHTFPFPEFIAEPTTADKTNHSKSGLGLPSIVALVMVIDKSWTSLGKHEKAFYTGLKKFVDDCKPLVDSAGNIRCPCKSCRLVLWVSIKHLSDHISKYGFDPSYKTWIHHGEPDLPPPPPVIDNTRQPQMSDMTACLNDLNYIPLNNEQNEPTQGDIGETSNNPTQAKRKEFEELYASANEELYPGCDYVTRLNFMEKFTYFKVKGKLTDYIFNEMLEFFQNLFPIGKGYKLPPSYYAIKKTFKTIGLGYESIHACVNDCFLFWGDANKDVHFCQLCNTSRWKDCNTPGKKVPKKVLHYFSIIPKLQRLYKSSHTAKEMTWHATRKCTEPGKMQHPIDGRAWKDFDTKYSDFAAEPRNSSFMLTLLIPGPKSLGKDIDVYLRPLIDDLKDLRACPTCNEDTPSVRVLGKTAYVGHRRFLKKPHKWRRSLEFNGKTENGDPPREFGRDAIMTQLARLPTRLMNDKSKDTAKARQDLKRLGIRSGLWLGQNKNKKCSKSQAAYSFTSEDRKKFSNSALNLMVDDMLKSQIKVIDILCNFELIYPPAFFNIMIYLVIHLPLEVFNSLCKLIGLRSVIRIDHQELKKVIWYVLHNSPEIDTYRAKFKSEFPNKDMKEEFPGWFGKQEKLRTYWSIRQRHVENDPGVSESSELFALACGPSQTPILVNSCVVNGVRCMQRVTAVTVVGDDRPHSLPNTHQDCGVALGNQVRAPKNPIWVAGERANLPRRLVRICFDHPSWRQVPPEQKAGVVEKISRHLQKIYNGKKAALKERYRVPDEDETYDVERIRRVRPSHISEMESSATREYPSLIHTFFLTHTVGGVFLNPEDKALYDEMLRLQSLGSETSSGVPYTEEEIMVIIRGGKQRGHIPDVGKVLPGQGTVIPPPPTCTHSYDVAKLKKSEKRLTKQVNMFMKLFRSNDKFYQMLTQLESQPGYDGSSRSGECEDDEPGDDEDGGEDGKNEDDSLEMLGKYMLFCVLKYILATLM